MPSRSRGVTRLAARLAALLAALLVVACRPRSAVPPQSERERVGSGYMALTPTPGETGPTDEHGRPVSPKVAPSFDGAPPTHDWWSSLLWSFRGNPHSEPMFPHPLSLQAETGGLQVGAPREPEVTDRSYFFDHRADLIVGVAGLRAARTLVVDSSDWTVEAAWSDGPRGMHVTMGHGLPFVYVTQVRGRAQVRLVPDAPLTIVTHEGNVLVVEVDGRPYGLFAPRDATWRLEPRPEQTIARSDLAGESYFSVAALPDAEPATIERFLRHAYCYVTGSSVEYRWEPSTGEIAVRYAVFTRQQETGDDRAEVPLLALYRHQWLHVDRALLPGHYPTARGSMRLLAAAHFSTSRPALGLLPYLPDLSLAAERSHSVDHPAFDARAARTDRARRHRRRHLAARLRMEARDELFPPGLEGTRDSFWEGKHLGRAAALVPIADQLGELRLRDHLLKGIERELEDWFDGQPPRFFYYDRNWRTLIGIPTIYYSGALLNDHHFHYGYYIHAAATVARYDRAWAERWAPNVEMLIKDAANWERDDPRFPFLRHFDPYAGHSWASGTTFLPHGNNQESSGEDLNFAASLVLWGTVMDRPEIRDTGLMMVAVGSDAVEQYWYDVDRAVYPAGFDHPSVGIVWGSGAAYDTWFSHLPAFVHGIQLTPMHIGAQWLGRRPDNIRRVLAHARAQNEGELVLWRDMFWMLEALVEPQQAHERLAREHWFVPERGSSMTYLDHFIGSMRQLGTIVPDMRADSPMAAAFDKGGTRTWVAYNPQTETITVRFSDGTNLRVEPGQVGWSRVGETE
ncbi:MAG: glycosyl hydrolase [Myxococcota bacterium]